MQQPLGFDKQEGNTIESQNFENKKKEKPNIYRLKKKIIKMSHQKNLIL